MDSRPGKKICFGVCPHGHALLWVGEERVRLTPEQLRTLVRLGTEALIVMGEEGESMEPMPVSTHFH